jgi:hypothetical protein
MSADTGVEKSLVSSSEEPRRSLVRRSLLRAGIGLVQMTAAGGITASSGATGVRSALSVRKIKNLTGPEETGRFGTPWTDLGIPVKCPDDSMLFVGGDSFGGPDVDAQQDWRAPVGLRSGNPGLDALIIDSAVGGDHAGRLVRDDRHSVGRQDGATAIPSDVFRIGDTLYMHLMRGVIYQTDHSVLWRSTDNGNTWEYLCEWSGDMYGGFIIPGSTLDDFHIAVSQWFDKVNYRVMHYQVSGLAY